VLTCGKCRIHLDSTISLHDSLAGAGQHRTAAPATARCGRNHRRAKAAIEIGRLKRDTSLPIYEPDRERVVFENVQGANPGPLPGRDLVRIYERIIDVMRNIQKEEIVGSAEPSESETELDSKVND